LTVGPLNGYAARDDYLERTIRTWLGVPLAAQVAIPSLPDGLARLLLREEEFERPERDRWGRWEFSQSENFRRGLLWTPEIDEWVVSRRRELAAHAPLEPLWPEGHAFAVCLTHDVDMVSRQATPRQIARSIWMGLTATGYRSRPERIWAARAAARAARFRLARAPSTLQTLERCVGIEEEQGVESSYFFTVYPPARKSPYDCAYAFTDPCVYKGERRRVAEVIRSIGHAGFDVGLHGGYHTALDGEALVAEKTALENAAELELTTTRQHYLHWDAQVTPRLQEEAGFRADSTLGFNRNIGFRAGTSLPFRHFERESGRTLDLLEVPLVVQDGALLGRQSLALDTDHAREVIAQMLDRVAAVGGVATMLFHPHVLGDDEIADLYRWSIDYGRTRGGWVTSLRRIERWWRQREALLGSKPLRQRDLTV
jgi:peptidoglycan/xylan/chitin deacetylase (PgdA/CDA1 family)